MSGRRRQQRPQLLREAVGWALVSWVLAVGIMAWSGVDVLTLVVMSVGLLVVGLAPMGVLKLTGARFRNLENLRTGKRRS